MRKCKSIFAYIGIIGTGLISICCSGSLEKQFIMCQNGQQTPAELLQNSDVKEAIVTGYSQQYYEKLLETGKIFSDVLYDSIQKNYHLYAWILSETFPLYKEIGIFSKNQCYFQLSASGSLRSKVPQAPL
jgi:hypothetical protein